MIKLVVSDIDGTLLPYGETKLSGEIFSLIEQLKERGIPFCPTSGRQYHSIRSLFPHIADELSYVCENGGVIYVWRANSPAANCFLGLRQRGVGV